MLEILNIVLPVFLVIGVGYVLGACGFVTEAANGTLTKLVFYVAAPALLFRSAALTPLFKTSVLESMLLAAGVTFIAAFLVYAAAARTSPSRRGVLAQGAHRSNMVFMGLPVIMNAYGDSVLGPAAVLIGFMVVVYNFLAVLVLTLPHQHAHPKKRKVWGKTLWEIAKNPLILASGGGLLCSGLDADLPVVADRTLELVGRIAMPLALISLGAGLDFRRLKVELGPAAAVCAVKLIAYPALVCIGLYWLGHTGVELEYPVLIMASPTAVVSYVMVREMKGDEQLASAIVIGTTIGSLFTISAWLAFFRLALL